MYTVMGGDDGDGGYYLRATAMYDDGHGMDKTASEDDDDGGGGNHRRRPNVPCGYGNEERGGRRDG